MQHKQEHIVSRIGEKGYLELVSVFLALGFENINDVPEVLWEAAVRAYEENLFREAA